VNSVTWKQLLANNEVQRHKTSKKELDKLRAVIRRDLADAAEGILAYPFAADCDSNHFW
jgi:hypothetical protein